jgi:hypothetical protein
MSFFKHLIVITNMKLVIVDISYSKNTFHVKTYLHLAHKMSFVPCYLSPVITSNDVKNKQIISLEITVLSQKFERQSWETVFSPL